MNALAALLALLLFGVALPAALIELLLWVVPKTPGYERRVMGKYR